MCRGIQNMGRQDRWWRLVIGTFLIILAVGQVGGIIGRDLFVVAAVILVGTSFTGFCAIYRVLGWRTCAGEPTTRGQKV